jgi:hypothetical protein
MIFSLALDIFITGISIFSAPQHNLLNSHSTADQYPFRNPRTPDMRLFASSENRVSALVFAVLSRSPRAIP